MPARFCCYCGAAVAFKKSQGFGMECENCQRQLVRPPCQNEEEVTDDETLANEMELTQQDFRGMQATTGLSTGHVEHILTTPPDHQEMMYGYIERFRGDYVHTFHFRREADGAFILAATMPATKDGPVFFHTCSNLNMKKTTMSQVPRRRGQPGFIACLIPTSMLGTEFLITTREESSWTSKLLRTIAQRTQSILQEEIDPLHSTMSLGGYGDLVEEDGDDNNDSSESKKKNFRRRSTEEKVFGATQQSGRELGFLVFDANLLGSQPNTVKASVRANPDSDRAQESIRTKVAKRNTVRSAADLTLFERLRGKRDRSYRPLGQDEDDDDEIVTFETKKPQWSESMKGWTLDFNGRVTLSSKKNFILVPSEADEILFGADTIGVRFGKVSKHRFNLDYRFPFSPLTTMALAISMFCSKLAVAW